MTHSTVSLRLITREAPEPDRAPVILTKREEYWRLVARLPLERVERWVYAEPDDGAEEILMSFGRAERAARSLQFGGLLEAVYDEGGLWGSTPGAERDACALDLAHGTSFLGQLLATAMEAQEAGITDDEFVADLDDFAERLDGGEI